MTNNPQSSNLVNIGTKEKPVFVPADVANNNDTPRAESWWQGIATGSIAVSGEILNKLLNINDKKK